MKKILRILTISGIVMTPGFCIAQMSVQADTNKNTIRIAANVQYDKAGKFKRIMLGEHYRWEWATRTTVEILDINKEAGGLTPVKLGGGMQTASLRLKGADGKEYVLRSVNKDPSKAIAAELRGTFAEDLVKDQISSANPYAPLVVSSLATAAGILNIKPRLVYVPVSDKLGEHASKFGNALCLFEERPSGNEFVTESFAGANRVINSQKLFEKIFNNGDHTVDEKAFIKARLFDMLIGDWDRHEDQWLWAAFTDNGKMIYKPIPRDRDQAFPRMDGVIPTISTRKWGLRKIQHFDYEIRDINGLNTNGGFLDRSFTTRLQLTDWMNAATELQLLLTDKVIDSSCALFPAEIYALNGKGIAAKLKKRRNDLKTYAADYYHFISQEVNIVGTNKKEVFEVTRMNDNETKVVVYNETKTKRIYQRVFLRSETKEIRLYGLEGNDVFDIKGETAKGILVRAVGGKGNDNYMDVSHVNNSGKSTIIYDDAVNQFNSGDETKVRISNDTLKNNYNRKSFRYDWLAPLPQFGYNPDDGMYIGLGFVFNKQQFGKAPYGSMHALGGSYAFATGAYNFWYKGLLKEFAGKWDLGMKAIVNAPNYTRNYYGLGNETVKADTTNNYYRVRFDQVLAGLSLKHVAGKRGSIETVVEFESVKVEETEDRFVSTSSSKLDSSDFERRNYVNVKLNYQFSTLDNEFYPTKGMKLMPGISFSQDFAESKQNFVRLSFENYFYTTIGKFTLATNSGVATNIGDEYAFFQANTLGGTSNLRGYRRDRYAGKTSLYSNTELRYKAGMINGYFMKGYWGLLAFADNGRVWVKDEASSTWHSGYGGGVWFLPFNKIAFTATYAVSKEENMLNIKAGFLF